MSLRESLSVPMPSSRDHGPRHTNGHTHGEAWAFYRFVQIESALLVAMKEALVDGAVRSGVRGLIILAPEGFNGTVAGAGADLERFASTLRENLPEFCAVDLKRSPAAIETFRKFKVDIREEVVTFGCSEHVPLQPLPNTYLDPQAWEERMKDPDVVVLDVRNRYESEIGKFTRALCAPIDEFRALPAVIAELNIPREKTVLMYCTGGIRCEKAAAFMQREGYSKVHQLHGGILRYLEELPNRSFEGECYVFDNRLAVQQDLSPTTQHSFCPLCGDPAQEFRACVRCGRSRRICNACLERAPTVCSKRCRNEVARARSL